MGFVYFLTSSSHQTNTPLTHAQAAKHEMRKDGELTIMKLARTQFNTIQQQVCTGSMSHTQEEEQSIRRAILDGGTWGPMGCWNQNLRWATRSGTPQCAITADQGASSATLDCILCKGIEAKESVYSVTTTDSGMATVCPCVICTCVLHCFAACATAAILIRGACSCLRMCKKCAGVLLLGRFEDSCICSCFARQGTGRMGFWRGRGVCNGR